MNTLIKLLEIARSNSNMPLRRSRDDWQITINENTLRGEIVTIVATKTNDIVQLTAKGLCYTVNTSDDVELAYLNLLYRLECMTKHRKRCDVAKITVTILQLLLSKMYILDIKIKILTTTNIQASVIHNKVRHTITVTSEGTYYTIKYSKGRYSNTYKLARTKQGLHDIVHDIENIMRGLVIA